MNYNISDISNFMETQRFEKIAWLIDCLEGFKEKVYIDIAGKSTIGYGHEIIGHVEEDLGIKFLNLSPQTLGKDLSKELAQKLLAYDIISRANIQDVVKTNLTDPIWIALTSFCFNIGIHKFIQTDAYKCLYTNDLYKVADSLSSWRECNGTFSEGIAKRRLCEVLILLQKNLDIHSPILPSKQFNSTINLPFTDGNWLQLSLEHKQQAINIYNAYTEKFSIME